MAHEVSVPALSSSPTEPTSEHAGSRLGWFLCWAVVFADIGTSVYYTPGILFGQVGRMAGLFVFLTLIVFVLLTLKYAEVSVRFPEGGGVVTVAARGLNPWAGAVGGMFILVDYFLTSAISSLSGLQYLQVVIPPLAPYELPVTLIVLVLLGLLNWWGIKESASVSAIFAVAAFVSDLAILLVVFVRVPPAVIGRTFTEMFTSHNLAPVTYLTGYAGAFLAFSGLESISQLSPVMRVPRNKTVTLALTCVALTVGLTSPFLTLFSTTLLDAAHTNNAQFVSALGGAYGGHALAVFTAITASCLLIFASNTAIIGAYHVFLALSRMQFFPHAIERTNKMRHTPHIAIFFATAIPMAVLIAVRGNINILGDMYAFGLLGAFSLTCIALDVIRYRERHGEAHVGAVAEEDQLATPATAGAWRTWARKQLGDRVSDAQRTRMQAIRTRTQQGSAMLAARTAASRKTISGGWPSARYYLGFLTTFLVVIAWCTNLVSKPLATEFGGGLTALGVAIAVINFRNQQRAGIKPVFPLRLLPRVPDSTLVVLPAFGEHNGEVIRAAVSAAREQPVIFLYVAKPEPYAPVFMQINDPYFRDVAARKTFQDAATLASENHIRAEYVYWTGSLDLVADAWRLIRPQEILAEESVAKKLARIIPPEYVRYQLSHGLRVAHMVRHRVQQDLAGVPVQQADIVARANGASQTQSAGSEPSAPGTPGANGKPPQQPNLPPSASAEPNLSSLDEDEAADQGAFDDWVWTGTDLVRRDQLDKGEDDSQTKPRGDPRLN